MQCPGCGFQNMPGVKQCAVCSASLAAEASAQDVTPPRARDRSLRQRLRYLLDFGGGLLGSGGRAGAQPRSLRDGWKSAEAGSPRRRFFLLLAGCLGWVNLRSLGQVFIAVIPGFGHWFVLGRAAVGRLIFAASAAALLLAVPLYRTPLSNLLVCAVVLASAVSVYCVAFRFASIGAPASMHTRLSIGMGLLVTALYLGTYLGTLLLLSPVVQAVMVFQDVQAGTLKAGDTALLWIPGEISRGDVVVTWIRYGRAVQNVVRVYGVPGDRVSISDRLYVNGRPTDASLPPLVDAESEEAYAYSSDVSVERKLGSEEYWVVPNFNQAPDVRTVLDTGTITREDIVGRVIAIINPPARRGLLARTPTIER